MNTFAAAALIGWIPISIALFAVFAPRTATLVSMLGGWMFLPEYKLIASGLPDYTKGAAVSLGALLGLACFGGRHLAGLRLGRHDLPMLAWCLVPAAASLANDRGLNDAIAVTLARLLQWGIPYLVGRAMFPSPEDLTELARALFVAGLVYAPFCLWEVRMSPQLHAMVYGFAQHSFVQCLRMDGYRPMVFMEHGLMVGLWMTVATAAGFALWRYGGLRSLGRLPAGPLLLALLVTTVLCKSTGALVLLVLVACAIVGTRALRSRLPLQALIAAPALFVFARIGLGWEAKDLTAMIENYAPDRARSVEFRIVAERAMLSAVWRRPLLGWSSWGVDPSFDARGSAQPVIRDSYWIITASNYGLVGLALFFCLFCVPLLALVRRTPVHEWRSPRFAGTVVVALALWAFVCDCLLNAMINPAYIVALGGVTSLAARVPALAGAGPRPFMAPARTHRLIRCQP
jgi:hypothetical protein